MDCPPGLRGFNYPTHLSARCPSYDACVVCYACTKYNPHDLICAVCESRKPYEAICRHTDDDQYVVRYLSKLFKKSMAHPDDKEQEVSVPVAHDEEWNELSQKMDPKNLGRIGNIQEE